eukprot:gene6916-8042_t
MANYDDYSDEDEELVTRIEDFEPPVQLDTSFGKFIIVDGLPEVPESKFEKLEAITRKIYTSLKGEIVSFYMPVNASKITKGYAFIEYTKRDSAVEAFNQLNRYQLDKSHQLRVNFFDDHKKFANYPETYNAPKTEEFVERDNYHKWLYSDRSLKGYDQFALRYTDQTEICWNEMNLGKPVSEKVQKDWTASYVQWSNSGSYLVTLHPDGVALYGGENWSKVGLFEHRGVQLVDFSPEDKYLITFSPVANDNPKDPKVLSGKKLRGFLSPPKESFSWPSFHWSAKDKYFARQFEDKGINIYEAPSCNLLDNKITAIARIKDFSWSPTDLLLCYFVPCTKELPGKISILEVPTYKILAEKNIWEANDARMHWQNQGDFLCVKIDKLTKLKKGAPIVSNFELFRLHEAKIPIENFEIANTIKAFAWEPRGKKLCIIHGEHRHDMTVSFYEVQKLKVALLSKLERRKLNTIYWSPRGTYILLATVGDTGELEFYNTADCETMATGEHLQCTGVDWNPSGRYVTTYVSYWKVQTDTGFRIWSFAGEPVYNVLKDRFYQFVWRPRPPLILSSKDMKSIKTKLKEYSKKFKELDDIELKRKGEEENARLAVLMNEFLALVQKGENSYIALAPERAKLNIYEDVDTKDEYQDFERVEEIIDVSTQVIKK